MYSQNFKNKSNKFRVTDIEFKVIVKKWKGIEGPARKQMLYIMGPSYQRRK